MEVKIKNQNSQPEPDHSQKRMQQLSKPLAEDGNNAVWLNPAHPNFERWKRGRELSIERGKFVHSIVNRYLNCKNLTVLDLGSGEGGTSFVFSGNNKVVSCDLSLFRLQRQKNNSSNLFKVNGNALFLPFKKNSFNLIILQDVLEHFPGIRNFPSELNDLLKQDGTIYLSTPNKYSLFNFIADPHWGLPVISVLKRETIKKFFIKYFRKNEILRKDIPELLSLKNIETLFSNYSEIKLQTKQAVERLLNGSKGILWSNFHLFLCKILKKTGIERFLFLFSNNKKGFINNFLNPTFYFIIRKKN
jgi:SAM-dependent methyltransferase